MRRLVVGLGNPGERYKKTRHNMGFLVVQALAQRWKIDVRSSRVCTGQMATGVIGEVPVVILLPETYMNNSGFAVRRCMDYYKIAVDDLLVIADDVVLPFGQMRIRPQGSAGGHNGLKSVEQHVGSVKYSRLRIGVGGCGRNGLVDHVLGCFSGEEGQQLPEVVMQGVTAVEHWLKEDISQVMNWVNAKIERKACSEEEQESNYEGRN